MNLTKKTILAFGLLFAGASFATAQTVTTAELPTGVLGQSFGEINVGLSDFKHFGEHQYGAGVAYNLPLSANFDFTAAYNYARIEGLGHANQIGAGVTAYTTFNGVKPFVSVGLGHGWYDIGPFDDEEVFWVGAVGVEIPVGTAVTLTPRISFGDDFHGNAWDDADTSYDVEANVWVNNRTSVFASVGYTDVRNTNIDSWDYSVGVRFKF